MNTRLLIAPLVIGMCALSTATALAVPTGDAVAVAVTFDAVKPSRWVHSTAPEGVLIGDLLTEGADVELTSWQAPNEALASPTLAVPGVDPDDPHAGDFPDFSQSSNGERAVFTVTPTVFGTADPLAPGTGAFSFEADVRLDEGDTTTSGTRDNGNNVVQRGLASGDQYKLEFDKHSERYTASCSVRDRGSLRARISREVEPGQWYRIQCARSSVVNPDSPTGQSDALMITVTDLTSGLVDTKSVQGSGPVADITFGASTERPIPLSIGGKTLDSGLALANRADQFNGLIDNVLVRIG